MTFYSITYDLHKDRDYERLYEGIKKASYQNSWARPTQSQWLVYTQLTKEQLIAYLSKFVDRDDTIFIIEVDIEEYEYINLRREVAIWLSN